MSNSSLTNYLLKKMILLGLIYKLIKFII